jgi:hypothetical protein
MGTATASCLVALLGSAMVRSTEQAMPVLVVTVMATRAVRRMIPVTGRVVLDQLSWLFPDPLGLRCWRGDRESHKARHRSAG